MTHDVTVGYEPLPGYRLLDHVGDGGYGEVWRAEAPGGLTKAIKFIFGQESDKRAISELRSLEKIRGLRHPFLLSLERIEAVDGRLMIVTELADESVRDRFDAYRQQGLPGIPRDELIGYLRDAADALDFISARHALQHLDIKPENLLLVARHVKVADFGLVKNVQQTQASLVGGMTPLYSAPEVFRGSPSRRSDQYSLAILYQEMLTGTMPFAGANAAELTLQHLSDEPELSPLTQADRYVVSRALAKEPEHRYPSCLDFVNALHKATDAVPEPKSDRSDTRASSVAPQETALPGGSQTELFGPADTGSKTEPLLIELPPSRPIVELPSLELDEQAFRPTPTLILGVGGAAGHVLSHLRRQLADQFGEASKTPAMQMLLLDTDPKALAELTRQDAMSLGAEETLSLPLHRPQHYRNQSEQLLHWLSRRWLYNIPRSMRTEGLRPLGRLALADHARQACQRIRMALGRAVDPESIAVSSQTKGQVFRQGAVRVYVVASISGGTGSGMALDLGYAVRTVLDKMGITDAHIIGLMMHSTGREPRHCELARVNAYSWLTEFHHFSQPRNAYPGDSSCGFPPHAPGVSPFDQTYLVHLGDGLDAREFDAATQSLADYLMLDALTPAQEFFDECRRDALSTDERGADPTNLRSFGIYRKAAAPTGLQREMEQAVCRRVIAGWQGTDALPHHRAVAGAAMDPTSRPLPENCTEPVVQGAVTLIHRLQLEPSGLAANARTLIEAQLGSDATTYLSGWITDQGNEVAGDERANFAALDRLFEGGDTRDAVNWVLGQSLDTIVKPLKEKLRGDVRRWAITRIDDPLERLAGARQAVRWLEQHFQAVDSAVVQLAQNTAAKISELRRGPGKSGSFGLPAGERGVTPSVGERLSLYFRLRLDLLAYVAAGEIAHTILSDLKAALDEFTSFGRELERMASAMTEAATEAATTAPGLDTEETPSPVSFEPRLSEMAAAVDRRVQEEFLKHHGGMLEMVLLGGRPRMLLTEAIQRFAQQAVEEGLSGADILTDALRDGEKGVSGELPLRSGLALAMPTLLQFGGARRVLAVLPKEAAAEVEPSQLAEALGTPVSQTVGYDKSLLLCVEAQQLSLPHVAVEFVENRRDCTEFAARVHSRTDIRWAPLVVEPAKAAEALATNVAPLAPLSDPLMQQTQPISFGTD